MFTALLITFCLGCYPSPFPGNSGGQNCDVNPPAIVVDTYEIISRNNVELTLNLGSCPRNLEVSGPSGTTTHSMVSGLLTLNENPMAINSGFDNASGTWQVTVTDSVNSETLAFNLSRNLATRTGSEIMRGNILFEENGGAGIIAIYYNTLLNEYYTITQLDWNNSAGSGNTRKITVGDSAYSVSMPITPALPGDIFSWVADHRFENSVRGQHLYTGMSTSPNGVSNPGFATVLGTSAANLTYNENETSTGLARTIDMQLYDSGAVLVFGWINAEIDTPITY